MVATVTALATPAPKHPHPHPALTGGTPAANVRLGRHMAWQRGWVHGSWRCLRRLWNGESGWNHRARNPSSGAGGIPQALPMSKIATAGGDINSPRTQIRWGLGYIHVRYGGPCRALSAWLSRSPSWY